MFERGLSPRAIEYTNPVLQSALRQAIRWKMLATLEAARDRGPQRRRMQAIPRSPERVPMVHTVTLALTRMVKELEATKEEGQL
jgi:hypothetical protein